jgi:hypothetical protein
VSFSHSVPVAGGDQTEGDPAIAEPVLEPIEGLKLGRRQLGWKGQLSSKS